MSEPGSVTCAACGSVNAATAATCQTCGRALPGLADRLFSADTTPAEPSPPPAPRGALFDNSPAPEPPPAPPLGETPAPPPPPPLPPPVRLDPANPPEVAAPDRPRSRTRLLLLAIVVVLAVAAAAFVLLGGDDPEPTVAPDTTGPTVPAEDDEPTGDTTATTASTTTSVAGDPPAPPSNLAVTPESRTALAMTWIDNADDEDRYLVARVRSDVADQIADLPANSAGYVVDGLEPNTLYCLTVAATNSAVTEPDYVEPVCAVTSP